MFKEYHIKGVNIEDENDYLSVESLVLSLICIYR